MIVALIIEIIDDVQWKFIILRLLLLLRGLLWLVHIFVSFVWLCEGFTFILMSRGYLGYMVNPHVFIKEFDLAYVSFC